MKRDFNTLTSLLGDYNQVRLLPGLRTYCPIHEELYIDGILDRLAEHVTPTFEWYESLFHDGPGQSDRLFPWLAEQAPYEAMRFFLIHEAAGEAGFGDLVALTQAKMPAQVQLEMARNYWDEMGRGQEKDMHGGLLQAVLAHFHIEERDTKPLHEVVVLNNLMMGFACNRCYAYHSLGALGVIEMTAPGRVKQVDAGLKRLGVPKEARAYFTLHGVLDVRHSREWNREVIKPFDGTPAMAEIALGAYARLWAGSKCFEAYRSFFEGV